MFLSSYDNFNILDDDNSALQFIFHLFQIFSDYTIFTIVFASLLIFIKRIEFPPVLVRKTYFHILILFHYFSILLLLLFSIIIDDLSKPLKFMFSVLVFFHHLKTTF